MTKLYLLQGCPAGHRAAFALDEKGIVHERVFFKPGQRPPELAAVGPNAKSPTLFDDDARVYESGVVLEYIEDRFRERPLLPESAIGRANVRMLIARINDEVGSQHGNLVREVLKPQRDDAQLAEAKKAYVGAWAKWDAHFEGREFVAGDTFTIADIALYTFLPSAKAFAGIQLGDGLPNLHAWIDRIAARPAAKTPTAS